MEGLPRTQNFQWKVLGRLYREGRLRSPSEGPKCSPKTHESPPELFMTLSIQGGGERKLGYLEIWGPTSEYARLFYKP